MRRGTIIAGVMVAGFCGLVFAINHQGAPSRPGKMLLLAHRGVAQTFPAANVDNDTCTARIINPPTHAFLENTIASMRESFRLGADIVEFDVQPTTDGQFAIFHDWSLDCRTEGHGVVRNQSMAYLKTLDVGYGYTADGGKTFPFRGQGVGLMPSLDEVLAEFPDKRFLITIKSNDPKEGAALAASLRRLPPEHRALLMVNGGGPAAMAAFKTGLPDVMVMDKSVLKSCLLPYLALGWSGLVPQGCRNTAIPLPVNYAWLVWGFPYRLADRMREIHSTIWLVGPFEGSTAVTGIDTPEQFARVPAGFDGEVFTDEIALIGRARVSAAGRSNP